MSCMHAYTREIPHYFNTKSTDAQGILKPKSVIPREEGGLGFINVI